MSAAVLLEAAHVRSVERVKEEKRIKDLSENEMAKERTGLSYERTDLAHERTSLANAQTLLSYIRTAIAVLAAGVGMFEFVDNETIVKLGIVLMAVSPAFVIAGIIHFVVVHRKIDL